jgi:UDP-N-acetylmuramate--alanine ligase
MKSYYFIGILGSGMSALARVAHQMGHAVGGSDRDLSGGACAEFKSTGIKLYAQDGSGIETFAAELKIAAREVIVVKSTAIEDTVADIVKTRELGLCQIHRSELLAEFFNRAQCAVAAAGTAGKTSVSSMISFILDSCGFSPSFVIGGIARNFKVSSRYKESKHFIIEADESDGTIVKYKPHIGLLTNISKEHKELDELHSLFNAFISNIAPGGTALINISCSETAKLFESRDIKKDNAAGINYKIINFEYSKNLNQYAGDFLISGINLNPAGSTFEINGVTFETCLIGVHNVENFALSIIAAHIAGAGLAEISAVLKNYAGVARRLEVIGSREGVVVIDDYAHNPHEIKTAINAVKIFEKPVIAVYQPHGYGPTALTRGELCEAFNGLKSVDRLFINEIYYGGGTVNKTITSLDLVDEIKGKLVGRGDIVNYCATLDDAAQSVSKTISDNRSAPWIVLVMGARDINTICPRILQNISSGAA